MEPNFQFDAPMYVDFQNAASDDGLDSWFGKFLRYFCHFSVVFCPKVFYMISLRF